MSLRKYAGSIYQKNILTQNYHPRRLTTFSSNQNIIFAPYMSENNPTELGEILNFITVESSNMSRDNSSSQSVKLLSLYIRRNRNNIEEIIRRLSNFFDSNNNLSDKLEVDIINSVLNLLTEKSQIIYFLNMMLPILVNSISFHEKSISSIENINNTIGRLIKIGGVFTRKIILKHIELLFGKFSSNDNKNFKFENTKFALMSFLCKIIENSSIFAYNKLTEKTTFEVFLKILDNFKDPNKKIRYVVGELIRQFNHTLINRDYKTRYCYVQMIYTRLYMKFLKHLQENGDAPANKDLLLGLYEVLRNIYLSEPLFLKDQKIYSDLVDNIMKCQNSKNQLIRIDFIKFIPELYQINREVFADKFLKSFLEYSNRLLSIKTNSEIRNALLLTMGSLSLICKKKMITELSKDVLTPLIKTLINEKKIFDIEIFKCMADLLNNKENIYIESIVTKFDIFFILTKFFKTGLSTYKIEFLLSIMTAYSSFSKEHITTVIASLNVISLILCDEDFELEYFNKDIADNRNNFIDPRLEEILENTRKHIRKFIEQNNNNLGNTNSKNSNIINCSSPDSYTQCKCLNDSKLIIFALTLFSQIDNNLFLKDMLIFYNNKVLPLLLLMSKKLTKKILDLILCKFVKVYPEDINLSKYNLNLILDSIRNLIFCSKENSIKIYAFNILNKKTILHELILEKKDFFCCKLIGILSSNEDNIVKKKMIETVGLLAMKTDNKNYFISFVNKNITNILFTIGGCDDIIQKENLISLLLYYTIYLKNLFDFNVIEQIMETLLYLVVNIDYQGYIIIDILNIVYELLNTDLIINRFLLKDNNSDQKINQYWHLFLIICINNLKEGGDNTSKTETSLKVLYRIIRIQKINIYKDYTGKPLTKYIDSNRSNNINNSNINTNNQNSINNSSSSNTNAINLRKSLTFSNKKDRNNSIDNNLKDNNFKENYYTNTNNSNNNNNNLINNDLLLIIEKNDKINIVEILLQCVIKGVSDESLKTILDIFGLSGAMEPSEMVKRMNQDIFINHLEGSRAEQDSSDENENENIINRYNPVTKKNEQIDLSSIDPSIHKPITSLMRILKENSQQDLSLQIMSCLNSIINYLNPEEDNLIELILPTIIQVLPQFEMNYQLKFFENILAIIKKFQHKIKGALSDLVILCKNFIQIEGCREKILKIVQYLFEEFVNEMEIYYPLFIPLFLSLIKNGVKETPQLLKIFTIMSKNRNICSYINIILEDLTVIYLNTTEDNIISYILDFFEKVIFLGNTYLFYPLIINTLIEKFSMIINPEFYPSFQKEKAPKNPKEKTLEYIFQTGTNAGNNNFIITKSMDIFVDMNEINREHFITFIPMIVKNCKNTGIIKFGGLEQKIQESFIDYDNFAFMKIEDYRKQLQNQICKINCILGFNSQEDNNSQNNNPYFNRKQSTVLRRILINGEQIKNKASKKYSTNNVNNTTFIGENTSKISQKISFKELPTSKNNNNNNNNNKNNNHSRENSGRNNILRQSTKRKTITNNELILNLFDTSNCVVEEDWNEWFKSTSKILFEQSPSFALYNCHLVADYYFPLIIELYNYGFFSVYINNNDQNKIRLTNDLKKALENPKTPNDILLTILNLAEFIERRNVNMCFIDYYQFGEVAYKCRAFAKALYYKENDFIIKNDFDDLEDLIELYYELKLPESAIGLLKLAEKNKNKDIEDLVQTEKNKDKEEYIWYIKLHKYGEALDMITKQLKKEKEKENIDNLNKNKDICLNGLGDWEELLTSNNDILSDKNKDKDNPNNINNNNDECLGETYTINNNNSHSHSNSIDLKLYIPKTPSNGSIGNDLRNNTIDSELHNDINYNNIGNIQETIEKEILLSKACMNLGEWGLLKTHFSNINQLFTVNNDIDEQFMLNKENNDEKKNEIFGGENNEEIVGSIDAEESFHFMSHGLIHGTNLDSYENDYISFNKYLNKLKIYSKTKNKINSSRSGSVVINPDFFISYNELINSNPNLNFLENNEEILFDLNLYSSVLNIEDDKYDLAQKYISEARRIILSRIKSLVSESYIRGYELLVKNQMLFNLEQIIDYKQHHQNDKLFFNQMVKTWNQNLDIIVKDPFIYEKFLAIRSLVLPIEKEYEKYMDLSKICCKLNLYNQSEKILQRLKKKLNLNEEIGQYQDNLMNEIQIKIELYYNKCLFEKGDVSEAIDRSKYLVDLLELQEKKNEGFGNNLSKINNFLKSKIYGHYAIYKQKSFVFDKKKIFREENQDTIDALAHRTVLRFNSNLTFKINNNLCDDSEAIKQYFILSTKYNPNSYKIWHNYAMFNYKYYKFITEGKGYVNSNNNNKEISFATSAVNGFKNSLTIGGKNMNKTFQDLLRLIDIFFSSGSKSEDLLSQISESFNIIDIDAYLNVVPQLLCRFDLRESNVLEVLINILIKIGLAHPHAVMYSLIVMKFSNSKNRKSAAIRVLSAMINKNSYYKKLIDECEIFVNELNKCAMLLHEEWFETIEEIAKNFQEKDYLSMVNQIMKLHEKMKIKPTNMYEIHFYQKFGSDIKEAEEHIKQYINRKDIEYLKEAWEIYHRLYKNISEHFNKFQTISLQYVSPKLYNFKQSNISLPGNYYINNCFNTINNNFRNKDGNKNNNNNDININTSQESFNTSNDSIVRIKRMGNTLKIFNTKQHPRKMSMIGTDEKEYMFLLKCHEDLRQDERAMQLFDLVNTILAKDKNTYNKNLFIITYSVFPMSHNAGIIGWVPNCDTLHQLIKEQRTLSNSIPSVEHRKVYKLYPKFETGTFLGKVEIFKEALHETHGTELNNIIWIKSKNCETWLNRRTNYSRSLAVMSIVGYILGLGDRHPSNLMMSRKTGKIIHIDFGDCFEVAMKREKFPEKVPFRLTRMLIKALEVSGIEGTFRLISIKIMELLRENKDSLLAILGSFIHDPLISFRLMIPMIMKKRKEGNKNENKNTKNQHFHTTEKKKVIVNNNDNENNINNNNNCNVSSFKIVNSVSIGRIAKLIKIEEYIKKQIGGGQNNNNDVNKFKEDEKIEDVKVDEKMEEEHQKNEKKKMEEDERQIFNLFEEKDEIESEELNKIAQIVLERIKDKLSGTDFNPDLVYDAKDQVDKLIKQATSFENLAQSYLGWCPFW